MVLCTRGAQELAIAMAAAAATVAEVAAVPAVTEAAVAVGRTAGVVAADRGGVERQWRALWSEREHMMHLGGCDGLWRGS